MSKAASKAPAPGQFLSHPLSTALLSVYILFFRISRWEGDMRDWSAMSGVMITMLFLFMTASLWIAIASGVRLDTNKWVYVVVITLAASAAADRALPRKKRTQFEQAFDEFPTHDRVVLRLMGFAIAAVAVASIFLTVPIFQHTFHIVPKQ